MSERPSEVPVKLKHPNESLIYTLQLNGSLQKVVSMSLRFECSLP